MIHITMIALLGMLAGAQQPQVEVQELPKPGQTQTAQPGQPAKPEQPKPDTKQQAQPSDQTPKAAPSAPPAQQPSPQATPAPQPSPVGGQHVPAPEERERGLQGKPVGAFWTVIPGK